MSLAGALLTLLLFFAGLHSDAAKLSLAQNIGMAFGFAIAIGGTILAIRARRAELPASEDFTYGSALGAGYVASIVSTLLSALFSGIYMAFINPGFVDVMVQAQLTKMREKGMTDAQIDQAEKMVRLFSNPALSSVIQVFAGAFIGLVICLVIAAFMTRKATASVPPPVAPPPVAG